MIIKLSAYRTKSYCYCLADNINWSKSTMLNKISPEPLLEWTQVKSRYQDWLGESYFMD